MHFSIQSINKESRWLWCRHIQISLGKRFGEVKKLLFENVVDFTEVFLSFCDYKLEEPKLRIWRSFSLAFLRILNSNRGN